MPPSKLKLTAYALVLLAFAHPSLVPPVLGALGVMLALVASIAGWVLTHLSLTLTAAACVLLARAFPGRLGRAARWLRRAWAASIAVVAPAKA